MSAISVTGLSKTYGRAKKALDSVSFDIAPGEMVALIGASGSGKSTLIRLIAGLIPSDPHGRAIVSVGGSVVQNRGCLTREARAVRRDIGVIFQQFNLIDRLSVLTNVLVGRLGRMPAARGTLGLFQREEKRAAMRALERVGIAETALRRASSLSGGQQQRAAIARALVQEARVLLADEPIASLDPASCRRVMETLSEINRSEGITIVVSLHQVAYARAYCPRTVALRDGQVVYDGPSAALTTPFLKEIYGAASEELILPDAALDDVPAPYMLPQAGPRPAFAEA